MLIVVFPIALLLSLLLRKIRAWQILSLTIYGLILSVGSAFVLITRSFDFSSWLMLLFMALPVLFHLGSLASRSSFTGYLSLLWIVAGMGLMFVIISSMSLLSLRSNAPLPYMNLALIWIALGAILPLIPRAAWPDTGTGWACIGLVFAGVQITAVLSALALSVLISHRAQQIAGDQACITDTRGARYHSRLWISPGQMVQNREKGITLPWLLLDDGSGEATHHWSFYALNFLPNNNNFAFYIPPRFYDAGESEMTC